MCSDLTYKGKIAWFGKYLGQAIYSTKSQNTTTLKGVIVDYEYPLIFEVVDKDTISFSGDLEHHKLVLKEIDHIDDEILLEIYNMIWLEKEVSFGFKIDHAARVVKSLHQLSNHDKQAEVVDYLRTKGYAIGIPKELYITQKEI